VFGDGGINRAAASFDGVPAKTGAVGGSASANVGNDAVVPSVERVRRSVSFANEEVIVSSSSEAGDSASGNDHSDAQGVAFTSVGAIDDVDAYDMFEGPMDGDTFHQLARDFYEACCEEMHKGNDLGWNCDKWMLQRLLNNVDGFRGACITAFESASADGVMFASGRLDKQCSSRRL